MSFPKWKYHHANEPKLVNSEAEELSLGEEWGESPAEFETAETYVEHMQEWPEKPAKKPRAKKQKAEE